MRPKTNCFFCDVPEEEEEQQDALPVRSNHRQTAVLVPFSISLERGAPSVVACIDCIEQHGDIYIYKTGDWTQAIEELLRRTSKREQLCCWGQCTRKATYKDPRFVDPKIGALCDACFAQLALGTRKHIRSKASFRTISPKKKTKRLGGGKLY